MQSSTAVVTSPSSSKFILSKYFSIIPKLQRQKLNHKAQAYLIKTHLESDLDTLKQYGLCTYRLENLKYISKFQIVDINCPESFYQWTQRKAKTMHTGVVKSQFNMLKIEENVGTPELNTLKEKKKKSSRN